MSKIGGIDWDETQNGFQYKLGYCQCGKKILATKHELAEIVTTFSYMKIKLPFKYRIYRHFARELENFNRGV